jgi:hypothetical protein
MPTAQTSSPTRALASFRRRVDAFFGDPGAISLAAEHKSRAAPPPTRSAVAPKGFKLSKSLTLHDGRVVAISGDASPLGADEDVRIVTTTTSVLDAGGIRVETDVLVFEKDKRS